MMKTEQQCFELIQKVPFAIPKPVGCIKKRQMLLTKIDGKWFMKKHKSKLLPMKSLRQSKEKKNNEDNIKQNIKNAHQHCNDRKLQIHWNNLKWVVPKICNAKKNPVVHLPKLYKTPKNQ